MFIALTSIQDVCIVNTRNITVIVPFHGCHCSEAEEAPKKEEVRSLLLAAAEAKPGRSSSPPSSSTTFVVVVVVVPRPPRERLCGGGRCSSRIAVPGVVASRDPK